MLHLNVWVWWPLRHGKESQSQMRGCDLLCDREIQRKSEPLTVTKKTVRKVVIKVEKQLDREQREAFC